jgi:hypothetical protein
MTVTSVETFSIGSDRVNPTQVADTRRLTADGALTELGGELLYCAVTDMLELGCREIILDLSAVTGCTSAGLRWARRAQRKVHDAGGQLQTPGSLDGFLAPAGAAFAQPTPGNRKGKVGDPD